MKISGWEDVFKDNTTFLFGTEPNKTIVEFVEEEHPNVTYLGSRFMATR